MIRSTIRPDLTHVETFLAVVEARGFARGGELLGLSQPAVSYRIARLEEALGTALFEEPRRRIILTPAGRALVDAGRRMLADLDAALADVAHGRNRTPLRIACPGAFGRNVVFPALRHPDVRELPVELLFRPLERIFDMVEAGDVDLGIAYGTRVTDTLAFREIAREEFCLVAPVGTCIEPDATVDGVGARTFVTYEECDYVFGKWFQDVYGSLPRRTGAGSRFSRLEEVVARVAEGDGCSIVPLHAVREALAEGRMERYAPAGRPRSFNREYAVTRPGWQERAEVPVLLQEIGRLAE